MPYPRGIDNNNPLNLKFNATDKWQGLADNPSDGTFFVFKDATYGIRAAARTLIAYQDSHGCKTIADFITRWAPPSDNNPTTEYVNFVANYLELAPITEINVHEYSFLRPMIEAMIQQENGQSWNKFYTSAVLDKALLLAGVEPPKKSLIASPQIIGGTVAVAATAAPTIMDIVTQTQSAIQPLTFYGHIFQYVFLGVALLGIGVTMWAKYKEHQRGIS